MSDLVYTPGSLVSARGREWVVLGGSSVETLRVRPVTGSDEDRTLIHLSLEIEPVHEALFPLPSAHQLGGHDSALLLRDALLLSLRRGAGPFRSFGQISVEPRAYQLVPLLMALKLDPVRLLIADDVGVGKTIEALLIARELLDRGDIDRTVVLCPPHLVDQWVTEMEVRFHIRAAAVTAQSARRLERGIPPGASIFSVYPHTVVSLDYIKTRERRDHFFQACPDFVIVDEAHTCASSGQGRHQRHELLQGLAGSASRHLVLLTATPHSGDDAAFYRLLGLLAPDFARLAEVTGTERERFRERLANHFVQRRRPDIAEWREGDIFPRRETKELTYKLSGAWETFFNDVLDYCAEVVETGAGDELRQRLNFWGTLALLRCTGSSPAAAVLALRTRAGEDLGAEAREDLLDRIFDGDVDALVADDVEPPVGGDSPALARLIGQAEKLAGQSGDPKLRAASEHVAELVEAKFNVVVFCRFIATAHYVARHLRDNLAGIAVAAVTGERPPKEREAQVARIGAQDARVLVATDCLSEGVNLQPIEQFLDPILDVPASTVDLLIDEARRLPQIRHHEPRVVPRLAVSEANDFGLGARSRHRPRSARGPPAWRTPHAAATPRSSPSPRRSRAGAPHPGNRRSPGSQSPRRAGRETAPAETPPATAGAADTAGRGSRRRPLPSRAAAPPRTDTAPPRGRSSETPASADNTSRHSAR